MFVAERLIGVVAPHECLGCGQEGSPLCAKCFYGLLPVPSRCYKCRAATQDSAVCTKCRKKSPLKHVWVCTEYGGLAARIIRAFKFERKQALSIILAHAMSETLPYFEDVVVVPVPTATLRVRQRGYDHSRLVARELSRLRAAGAVSLLARHGQSRQVGAKRQRRLKQMEGAFLPTKFLDARHAHVLLVDDVLTTGSTLEEAARAAKKAGAKQVDAIVFAQK